MKKNKDYFYNAVKIDVENVLKHPIEFKEFTLSNGLHCILYKNNQLPVVNITLGYKVGSKDELPGKKGIAHLFEHLMFQGSKNVKKNEHFSYLMKSGGFCNAFTMQDSTIYFDNIPSNNIEIALWLESDRMNSLNLDEKNLENQKKVVIEEKKQRVDNSPYGSMLLNIFKYIFKGSGYESPIIGNVKDINSFTVSEAVKFHNDYYSPCNCVIVISGDINFENTEELLIKYFSGIRKKNQLNRKKNIIKKLRNSIDRTYYDNIQLPAVNLCYQLPKAGSKEEYTIEFITEILANNKSSRLYKNLVYKKKLLQSVNAVKYMLEDSGLFFLNALLNPGVSPENIKDEFLNALQEFADKGCTDEEFERIKNKLESKFTSRYLQIKNISLDAAQNYLYFRNVNRINEEINNYLSVTKNDIAESLNKYIISGKNITVTYLPKNS
ncbi:MAG: hypothetical protein HGGPFJEG_02158 [Ignavibacteria bacterium]|nr:hypothetical protein [Ignavibacteria bacterium]